MSCIIKPAKVKHPSTGKLTESILYTQLKQIFPADIALRIYNKYASEEQVEKLIKDNPGENVLDDLNQPTMEAIKRDEWYQEYFNEYGGTQRERKLKAGKIYNIGEVTRKHGRISIKNGTEDFLEVANRVGDFHRSYQDKDTFTMAVYKKKVQGKWVYATEIVLATRENKAALEEFLRGCKIQEGMKVMLAKAGITSSVVDSLAENIEGEFDPAKPLKVLHSLFNLIKYSANVYKNGGLTERAKLVELEEMSHAFIAMFKDNPVTKDSYKLLTEYIMGFIKNNPLILLKTNSLINQDDINALISEYGKSINDKLVEELLGKVLAGILATNSDKTVKQIYDSKKKFSRVLNKADNIFKSIVEHCWLRFANSLVGTSEKTLNLLYKTGKQKILRRLLTDPKPFDWQRYKKDGKGMSKVLSISERGFYDEILHELIGTLGSLIGGELDVTDIKRNGIKLHRMAALQSTTISSISKKIASFYDKVDSIGIGLILGKSNVDVKYSNHENKDNYDLNKNSPLRRKDAAKGFLVDSLKDLKDIVANLDRHLKELDEGFKTACLEVIEASLSDNNARLLTLDALEMAANIKNFDKLILIISNTSIILNGIDDIIKVVTELVGTEISSNEFTELLTPFRDLLDGIRGVYHQYNKAALCILFGAVNNGRLYIDRGARLMETAILQKLGGVIKKGLTHYEGRKIPILELLSELKTSDGYFDINVISYFIQSAVNSTDPITLFVDRLTKQSKFTANRENARWHKAIIDFRRYCRKHDINTNKFFEIIEIDGKKVKTGNIVSNINWGLWEHDLEENRKRIKAQGIAAYIAELNGEDFDKLSQDEQDQRVLEVLDKKNLNVWYALSLYLQIKYLYKYSLLYYFDFHNTHSVNVNDIDPSVNTELLPEGAREYDPITDSFREGRIRTLYSKSKVITDEKTGLEYITNELSLKKDLNTRTFVPNLNFDNGRYRNELWDNLSSSEKEAINMYLRLKAELDAKLNRYLSGSAILHRLPQFRGTTTNRIFTEGFGHTVINSAMETIFLDSEDLDFGSNATLNSEESAFVTQETFSSFELRLRLPMFGVNKLKNMDQLTTDLYRGLLSYAIMANNVETMSNVAPVALLTKNVLDKRIINNTKEGDFAHIMNHKDTHSYIYLRFSKYVEMLIFGRYSSVTKAPSGKRVINWNKIFKKLSAGASWTALAGNFIGGAINTGTGLWNLTKEAGAGQYFNRSDLTKAYLIYTEHSVRSPFGSKKWNDNPLRKFVAYWDCVNKNEQLYSEFRTRMPTIFKISYEMTHYENGDRMMHILPYIARALNTTLYKRVVENGMVKYEKAGNAWDIFVLNCDRMKDSEQIKATKEIVTYNLLGEPLVEVLDNELSMSPYSYISNEKDPTTGKDILVVRLYCTRIASFNNELLKVLFATRHALLEYEDKQADINTMIDKNIESFKLGLKYNSSYAETTPGKKILNELRILCDLYNKYEYLKAQATYSKNKSGVTLNVDLDLKLVDLDALQQGNIEIKEDTSTTPIVKGRKKSFSYDKFAKMAEISLSDLDYEEFNDLAQTLWQDTCRSLCDSMHGIYNNIDGVVASQTGVGAVMMSMKKYYLGYLISLYQGSRDSLAYNTDIEGCVSIYWKLLKYSLRHGFFPNEGEKKTTAEHILSGVARGALVFHFLTLTAAPILAISAAATGAPLTCALGGILFLRSLNWAMHKSKYLNQAYQSVTSNSQRVALQRMFRGAKASSFWKMLGIMLSSTITKVAFDDDDKYLWQCYGKDDPRLKYEDIYELLQLEVKNISRNLYGELDANGKVEAEVISKKETQSAQTIRSTAAILKLMPLFEGRLAEIDAVADMMIFANTKAGRALDQMKYNAYVLSTFRNDEKFFKWIAQNADFIPGIDKHMFDDYAAKMAQAVVINERDGKFNVPGIFRSFTASKVDEKLIYLYSNNPLEFKRLMDKGVISDDIVKAILQRENALAAYNELTKYIGKYNIEKGDKDAFISDFMANLMNKNIYIKEQTKPTDFISWTYLFDVLDYGSSRWLNECTVLSPNLWWANPVDINISGSIKDIKALWYESIGSVLSPVLLSRCYDFGKWLGEISTHSSTGSQRSLDRAVEDFNSVDDSMIPDYNLHNKPVLQRIMGKFANLKYKYMYEYPFWCSLLDVIEPTNKRVIAALDFGKLKKQFELMRNK